MSQIHLIPPLENRLGFNCPSQTVTHFNKLTPNLANTVNGLITFRRWNQARVTERLAGIPPIRKSLPLPIIVDDINRAIMGVVVGNRAGAGIWG